MRVTPVKGMIVRTLRIDGHSLQRFHGLLPLGTWPCNAWGVAGYSGTPLEKKLGIKPGQRLLVLKAPPAFIDALQLPEGVELRTRPAGNAPFDLALLFVTQHADLARSFAPLSAKLSRSGAIWVAWPKLSARKRDRIDSDMTENAVRAVILPLDYVDNKVAAIDETWSGLRCVLRRERR